MAGRILSMQRQARELGRLRTGYVDGKRPVRSDTWIVSSHAEHYVQAAAQAWGGLVEKWQPQGGGAAQYRVRTDAVALDAILPGGDPLSQSFELWSGGGCQRRCDGITEMQSDTPCICRAQHGDNFHEQGKGNICSATTRLNVFLPDMPDVGVWRAETHSWYAASEIAGAVDLIRSAVGPEAVIPIRLRIEQRQRKANGQTKKFPVIVVELRGITTGQVLAGSVMGSIGTSERPAVTATVRAIEAAPQTDVGSVSAALDAIAAGGTLDDLRAVWTEAVNAGLKERALKIADEFKQASQVVDAEPVQPGGSVDDLWAQIMRTVPESWSTTRVEEEFATVTGVQAEQANAQHMTAYLAHLVQVTA